MLESVALCQAHLSSVLQNEVPLDIQLVNRMTDQLRLDKSLFYDENNEPSNEVIISLLPISIGLLKSPGDNSSEDLEPVIELIEALLAPKSFDEVLSFISIDDLAAGLESGISPLQTICIKQIAKAQPPDLVANTPLIDKLLDIFADPNSRCTQAVHDALVKLANKGELVIKRIFSESSSSMLRQIHDSDNAVLQGRLMSLLESILALNWSVPSTLLQFPLSIYNPNSPTWDILQTLTTIQFYRTIIENAHPKTLMKDISQQINAITGLFAMRNEVDDVQSFLLTEIFLLFRELSHQEPALFGELDQQYNIVSSVMGDSQHPNDRISLLTFVSPKYLLEAHPDVIDSIKFKSAEIPIIRNMLSYQQPFLKLGPDQSRLMALSYSDLLLVLLVVAKTNFGLATLLHDWPQVMNSIISKENIRQPEIFNLRRELLEILVSKQASTLGVWYGGIKEAYREVILGAGYNQEAQAIVTDRAM